MSLVKTECSRVQWNWLLETTCTSILSTESGKSMTHRYRLYKLISVIIWGRNDFFPGIVLNFVLALKFTFSLLNLPIDSVFSKRKFFINKVPIINGSRNSKSFKAIYELSLNAHQQVVELVEKPLRCFFFGELPYWNPIWPTDEELRD